MKKLIIISLLLTIILSSCDEDKFYPIYSLDKIEFIPDSIRQDQRVWVIEMVRAASENMSGGDYEDVDETIEQAEYTSRIMFESSVIGIRKQIDKNYWNDVYIRPDEFNEKEKAIFDKLSKE